MSGREKGDTLGICDRVCDVPSYLRSTPSINIITDCVTLRSTRCLRTGCRRLGCGLTSTVRKHRGERSSLQTVPRVKQYTHNQTGVKAVMAEKMRRCGSD